MKTGEVISHDKVHLIATAQEYERGETRLTHPRNGRVVIRRSTEDGMWRVAEVQRPDKQCSRCGDSMFVGGGFFNGVCRNCRDEEGDP